MGQLMAKAIRKKGVSMILMANSIPQRKSTSHPAQKLVRKASQKSSRCFSFYYVNAENQFFLTYNNNILHQRKAMCCAFALTTNLKIYDGSSQKQFFFSPHSWGLFLVS